VNEKSKIYLKTFFALAVTVSVFYIIFRNVNFFSVINILLHANVIYLILATFLGIFIILFFTLRWKMVLTAMDFPLTFRNTFDIIMGVFPFAAVTPSIASDGMRAVFLRNKIRASIVIGSVLTERMLEFATLLMFLVIGMVISNKFQFLGIATIIFCCILLIVYLAHVKINLPFKEIWNERLENIFLSLRILVKNKKIFLIVVSYTLLVWICSILQILVFFYALGIKVPIAALLIGAPVAILIGQIPITLGGAGTRDAAFIIMFSEYALPEQMLSVGIFFSFFRVWLPSIIGIYFMRKVINSKDNVE
jgi:uncharacterized protein (TIRG00374 family)